MNMDIKQERERGQRGIREGKEPTHDNKRKMEEWKIKTKPGPVINIGVRQSNIAGICLRCFKMYLLIKSSVLAARQ
jgi:hypothetical protein